VGVFVHERALCESNDVGAGTRIWAFAHVMKGARVGRDCNVGEGAFVEGGAVVGDGCTLKNGVLVWEGVTLSDGVFVGPGVLFTNDRAPRSPRLPEASARYGDKSWLARTEVGRGASIGAGAAILPGLSIGAFAVIGAGAVVTRDVPEHAVVAGNPARPLGHACACGLRLARGADGGDVRECASCRKRYVLRGGTLQPTT